MPYKCCAPNCSYNYASQKQNEDGNEEKKKLHMFKFPDHDKHPEKRAMWIRKVPREDWKPNEKSLIWICELHFEDSDIIRVSNDTNQRRKRKNFEKNSINLLKRPHLKDEAYPRIWPGSPAYLSKTVPSRKTIRSTCEERIKFQSEREREIQIELEIKDSFVSLEELNSKIDSVVLPSGVIRLKDDEQAIFFKFAAASSSKPPQLLYSVTIKKDLTYDVWYEQKRISDSKLKTVTSKNFNTISNITAILSYLESFTCSEETNEEIVDNVIQKLQDPRFDGNSKVGFIIEQLSLLFKVPTGRRYSPSMLAMSSLWERTSPSCYKQIVRDNVLTLPSKDHLRRLCSAFDMNCMSLTPSSIAYLKARFDKLDDKDKVVSMLMDEVYSHQDIQYVNGKFFGAENGELTKTILCVMLKSVAGKYRDIVCMAPVVNITADKLYLIWKSIVHEMSQIGFDIVVTLTDGHSSNVKLFNENILGSDQNLYTESNNETNSRIYLAFDPVHLFKNVYNNFCKKKNFVCPSSSSKTDQNLLHPTFSHLEKIYELEQGKYPKMAHKLSEKVLHPQPIEKTSVKLAEAVFHESTINTLKFYALNGYPHFNDTAIFLQKIRNWFNNVNVKSIDYGRRKKDELRNPIRRESVNEDLKFIEDFALWLQKWQTESPLCNGLSKETFHSCIRTCTAFASLVRYLFDRYPYFNYILLGNICSDYLEGRFGWYRQLCGGNYYNAVTQFLQAEKTIRLKSLIDMGYDMSHIKEIFKETQETLSSKESEEKNLFTEEVSDFSFDQYLMEESEESAVYYVAGYIAKCLIKKTKCIECIKTISPGRQELYLEPDKDTIREKDGFTALASRGGLLKPSDYIFLASLHASSLHHFIFNDSDHRSSLLKCHNPRTVFIGTFEALAEEDECASKLLEVKCNLGHSHRNNISRIAFTMFNVTAKNYVEEVRNDLRRSKKERAGQKKSKAKRKIDKLQSL